MSLYKIQKITQKLKVLLLVPVKIPVNKIKRRIKTPIKVKHGRFSLYDDRLMAQFVAENPDLIEQNFKDIESDKVHRSRSGTSSEFLLDGCDDSVGVYNVKNVVHVV